MTLTETLSLLIKFRQNLVYRSFVSVAQEKLLQIALANQICLLGNTL